MPNLLEQLQSITGDGSLSVDIAAQAGQFTQIAQAVKQLIDEPPGDFGALLGQLETQPLPRLAVGTELQQSLGALLPDLQGELGGLLQPLLDAAGGIEQQVGGALPGAVGPLLKAIENLQRLLGSDWSCGLVAGLAPPPPTPAAPAGGGQPPPAAPPEPPAPVLSPAQVTHAQAMIDTLPSEMSVPALLKWLHARIGTARPGYLFFRSIPVLDDLRDPLDTLVRWDGLDGAQLLQELDQTLGEIAAVIEANTAARLTEAFPSATVQALPAAEIGQAGAALAAALDALHAAVQTQDQAAIATQLGAAQAAAATIETHNATLDAQQAAVQTLRTALRALPGALETAICRLLVLLQPQSTWSDIAERLGGPPTVLGAQSFAPLTELMERVQEFFDNLFDLVDIGAVTEPIATALNQATQTIDQLEQGIAQLTAGARAQFQQAHDALQGLDIGAVQQQAQQALQGVAGQLQQALAQPLAPAANALTDALAAIEATLGGFDPEQLGQPVQAVLDAIHALLQDSAVQQLLAQLQQLHALADQLGQLSFRPVGDLVVDGIGEVKSALDSIDDANLVDPLPEMIHSAMAVLPSSLTPLTDPLLADLDTLIAEGPMPVLERLRDLPKPVVAQLQAFSPRELLEEPLGAPFRGLREQMAGFAPEHWLDGAQDALDALKQRLAASLDLGPLLAPLAEAQQGLLEELGRFRPGAVIAPLAERIEQAVQALAGAIPTTDLTAGLDQVLGQIRRITQPPEAALSVLQSLNAKLALLADPDAQLDAWLDAILAKLPADAPASLAARLAELAQAVAAAHAAPMLTAYQATRQGLADQLAAADAPALLAGLLQRRARLTPALVAALPASQAKTDLEQWLGGFDPAGPAFSRGLRQLAQLADALHGADQALNALLDQWDARYLRSDGSLAALAVAAPTVAELRDWLRQALDRQLGAPVVGFLRQLKVLGALLDAFTGAATGLVQGLNDKLDALLAAPLALQQAAQELEQLQARLSDLDLDLFTREVDALYQQLLGQLRALDPQALLVPLRQALEQALDGLGLDAVFTPALRSQLQQGYQALLAKVDALDPELLVIAPLEQSYQQDIQPVLEALDVSETVQAIIDLFQALPDELKQELQRVDGAYQQMLAAAPGGASGGGGSAGLSV